MTITLHVVAGLAALVLGGGVLLGDPRRARSVAFALLCGAFALWNLGFVGFVESGHRPPWRVLHLFGSCAAAPLGLYFALVLAEAERRKRLRLTLIAALPAALLWLAVWPQVLGYTLAWRLAAVAIIGSLLAGALGIIGMRMWSLPHGPERRAFSLVLIGGLVAALGGLTDFLPRGDRPLPQMGPIALLLFLLILCGVIVRHRFFDVGSFYLRSVALVAAASTVALIFFGTVRLTGRASYSILFLTSLAVLAAAGPLGKLILTHARALASTQDPVAHALLETSRKLSSAGGAAEIWEALREAEIMIPGSVSIVVFVRDRSGAGFEPLSRFRAAGAGSAFGVGEPLPRWLANEGLPITPRYLERERLDLRRERAEQATRVRDQLRVLDARMVVPLHGSTGMQGWMALIGDLPERYLTGEVATAFLAVANQATAVIERLRALEEARSKEALAAVGELAAGLAHEIRNPVAAIRGAAEALEPEPAGEQRAEMLAVISEETGRLGRFLGEFLEYARPRSPRARPVDIVPLIRRCLDHLDLAGVKIQVDLLVDAKDTTVLADADQLEEVVENLVSNARDAAGNIGQVSIRIAEAGADHLTIRFRDNGPGIPPDHLGKLFQPFHTTKSGGTGLGLAVVERIVQAHGGDVRATNHTDGGAEFVVTLARPTADASQELDR